MNKIKQSILAIVIGLVLSAGVSYAAGIWENPKGNPPNENTYAPINTGPADQIKAGALRIGNPTLGFVVDGASSFKGQSQFLNPVIFKGQITIEKSPISGAVLTSDAGGNASWQTQTAYTPDLVYKDRSCNTADCEISCPSGYKAISGGWSGWRFDNIDCSKPINSGGGWKVCNTDETNFPWTLHVVCIK